MSENNQEFSIPFEESRRGANSSPEEKAALGRLGRYLGSRAVNRPTIGERRRGRGGRDFDLPTGGKPGTRTPTGSRRDVDGDGWADEGTTKPVWVGMDSQRTGTPGRQQTQRDRKFSPALSSGADYMGQHQAPDRESGAPLDNLTANGIYPDDIYANNALEMYGFGGEYSAQALSIANSAKGKPNKQIKIYRAVPLSTEDEIRELEKQAAQILRRGRIPNSVTTPLNASEYYDFVLSEIERLKNLTPDEKIKINPGDWVTPIREYAVSHGRSHLNNKYKIVSKTVPASHLFTDGNSIEEWGYDPGLPSSKTNEQKNIFTPSKEEQGDAGETLSSGRKYQEIVDSLPPLSKEQKENISKFSNELNDEEFQKADVYIPDTRPKPPRPPGMPEPKPAKILQDSEERISKKKQLHGLIADALEGEMTLDEDVILKGDDGRELNVGKKLLIEVVPESVFYLPPVKINKVTDDDLKEQRDMGISDAVMEKGDLLTEINVSLRIKPLPEYEDKVLAMYGDNEVLRYVHLEVDGKPAVPKRDGGKPFLAVAARTFMVLNGDDKNIRLVSHDSFYVNDRAQGQGIGSAFNARNEQIYKELDVRSISTWGYSGGGSRGATHWPKNGFTWGGEQDKQKFIGIINNAIVETPELFSDEDRKKISSLYSKDSDGFWQTEATPEELLNFPAAEKLFSDSNAQIFYTRPLRELAGASSGRDRSSVLSSGRDDERRGRFLPEGGEEQGDPSEALSSGMGYESLVAEKDKNYPPEKSRLAKTVSQLLDDEELTRADEWITSIDAFGDEEYLPKPNESRKALKQKITDGIAELFGGEIELRKDLVVTAANGEKINLGNKVKVVVYESRVDVDALDAGTAEQVRELQLYDNFDAWKDGEILRQASIWIHITPTDEAAERLIAAGLPDDLTDPLATYGYDKRPVLGRAQRTINAMGGETQIVHDVFFINEQAQGYGIASQFNARNEKIYRDMGILRILTEGSSAGEEWQGATHWPRNGFTWAGEKDKQAFIALVDYAIKDNVLSDEERERISALYTFNEDSGLFETSASAEELIDFEKADSYFQKAEAGFLYKRDIENPSDTGIDSQSLSSGKAPRHPRTPTLGAFLGKADEDFADVESWEEFKRLYDDREVVFFDYETTGLVFGEFGEELAKGAPVQFGAVKIKNGKEVGRINLFMNPEEELGEWSRNNLKDVDGNPLTDEWLRQQMSVADAHRQLVEFAGPDALFGVQNATFDKGVLDDVLQQMGEEWRPSGYLDTREIAALTLPKWTPENEDGPFMTDREGNKKPSSSLAAITEYLGVDLGDGHHNADVDAFATSQVMQKMIDGAIEKGWSKDALNKEKRDALHQVTVDKFNSEVTQFEKDKKSYISSSQNQEGLSSGVRLSDVFEEEISPLDENAGDTDELGKTINEQARDIVARRVMFAIEKAQNIELNDGQKKVIESIVPDIMEEVKNKTLLDIELDDAFQDTGEKLLKSISVDVSSDGTPFVSADPIPQLAEQIPGKKDWRSIEIPKIEDVLSTVDETSKKGTVFFRNNAWYDGDGNIVARKGFAEDGSPRLEYENDEARSRFPLLEIVAPKGYVISSDTIGLPALKQGTLPGGYGAAWKKHGDFLMELGRRAGEMMGDEELFMRGSRRMYSTNTFLNGYIGGLTNPSKFNLGLDGEAQQYYHDLFGHLGTGRGFDRHGEWANDIAMMSMVDHPDSPLTPQEKLAVKHLHYMMYSSNRLIFIGRADEINHPQKNANQFTPKTAFDINPVNAEPTSMETSVYAGDFNEVIKGLTDSSPGGLSSGRKPIYQAEESNTELAIAYDALGVSSRQDNGRNLSSGRERPLIPMRKTPERKPLEPGKREVKGYGQKDASGKEVRRSSSKWLSGMTSDEMARVLVPSTKEEHFEMWADDIAGPEWRGDRKFRKFLKDYYDQLDGHENALRIDYSPEGLEASRELVRSMLDSSPQMKWMFENFGAPLIGVFTRDAMNEYEGRPDVKERMELLRQQRNMEKTPFVSGLASREFGFVGLTPRALIDRESYDDVGVGYPLEMDPNRKPQLRDAHVDRSLHGTLIHEYGHWLHYRAVRDLETNGTAGQKTYYGSGRADDPMYIAALDVAEEYSNPETDNEAIEIYSQFIDLTGRDAGEMFRAHPDKALTATSYGNVNKREAIAEAFVAIMHPNRELAKSVLSPKLRRDIYTLSGVDPDNLPWEERADGRPTISMSLSSGANETKPGREKRRNRISRALRQLVGVENEPEEAAKPRYEFEMPERPEGLVSFATEPSDALREALPTPSEEVLRSEVLNDVKMIPPDPILEEMSKGFKQNNIHGFGVGMFASLEDRKASAAAKRMISLNIAESAKLDAIEFLETFSEETTSESGLSEVGQAKFFGFARNTSALRQVLDAIKALSPDAADDEKAKAARFAVNRTSGQIVSMKQHDEIIQKRFYYDEMIDALETRSPDELFGSEWDKITALRLGDEDSIFTPYLITKVGGADITKDLLSRAQQVRSMLNSFTDDIKGSGITKDRNTGRELPEGETFAVIFSPIGDIDPRTGKPNMAIVSRTGTVPRQTAEWLKAIISDGKIIPRDKMTKEQGIFYDRLVSDYGYTEPILEKIAAAGITVIDSSNIDSDETKQLFKNFLVERMRTVAGNAEIYKARYQYESGVSFFDINTPEGQREARAAIVSDFIHTWAISANNSNPVALSIQHEVRKMFGLDESVGWYGRVRGTREGAILDTAISIDQRAKLGDLEFDDAPLLNEQQQKIVSSLIKAIYDATQHYYKSKGITHVAVWRGMRSTPEMSVPRGELASRRTAMRPLSSWTTSSSMAQGFATTLQGFPGKEPSEIIAEQEKYDENLLLKAYVPVEQIFSNPLTGFGCLGEDEVVLLGRPTDTIMITPPAALLPDLDENAPSEQQEIVRSVLDVATERDKQTNPAFKRLTDLDMDDFAEEFKSKQTSGGSESLSSGKMTLSSGKVIKYNWIDARMRAADMKVKFNRDPERVASAKATLAKGFMGGFTVEVDRMDDIKQGVAVARNKHGMKVDAVADFDAEGNASDELVDTFLAWVDFHGPKTFGKPKPGADKTTIGGWVSDGTLYLDVVDVYPDTDENIARAAEMGLGEDQIAVTNLTKLWQAIENGEDISPAFIDSGGTGGFTIDEESVRKFSAAMNEINSNKFNTGSIRLKRIGNTKKFTQGPITGARRVRHTDFETDENRDYWIISGADGMVKVFTHDQYIKVRDKKIQGLFDKMSSPSDILKSMFEAKNITPVASMSFQAGKNIGKPTVSKGHRNYGLPAAMGNLYGFANNIDKVGVQMGDKVIAAMA